MKIKPFYIIFLFVLLGLNIYSSKLEKGFAALEIHNYFKAKKLFSSINKRSYNAYASYGLSIIYYRNNNPFHNFDSAAKYANISYSEFLKNNKSFTFSSFKIDSANIAELIDSIAFKQLKECLTNNSIKQYDGFLLTNYLSSNSIRNAAIYNRDELEFKHILKINKSDSTHLYNLTHPLSAFRNDAHKLEERQVYNELTKDKTPKSYMKFISLHPKNSNVKLAYESLLTIYKNAKDKNGLSLFIKTYPDAPQLEEAWQLLFTLSVKTFSSEELESFITNYPNFPFKNSILKELELNNLVLIPIQLNELTGFVDTSGAIKIAAKFDEASPFKEGLSIVHKGDSVYYINKENKNTINKVFVEGYTFSNGLAPVKISDQWYLIDRLGEQKTRGYDEINELSEEHYVVKLNNLYGIINLYGKLEYDIKYEKLGYFKNGCIYYQSEGKYGFLSKDGYVHKAEFEWLSEFSENGIATYKNLNKFGLVKKNGQILTEATYDLIVKLNEKIYLFVSNNLYGFYSSDGCFLTDPLYDYQITKPESYYTNGAQLKLLKKDKQAIMDLNGKMYIDFGTFTEVDFASEGLICVNKNNKYGYVDRKLNTVITPKYSAAESFMNGFAQVELKNSYYMIDSKAAEILKSSNPIKRIGKLYFMTENEDTYSLYTNAGVMSISGIKSYEFFQNYVVLYLENNVVKIITL